MEHRYGARLRFFADNCNSLIAGMDCDVFKLNATERLKDELNVLKAYKHDKYNLTIPSRDRIQNFIPTFPSKSSLSEVSDYDKMRAEQLDTYCKVLEDVLIPAIEKNRDEFIFHVETSKESMFTVWQNLQDLQKKISDLWQKFETAALSWEKPDLYSHQSDGSFNVPPCLWILERNYKALAVSSQSLLVDFSSKMSEFAFMLLSAERESALSLQEVLRSSAVAAVMNVGGPFDRSRGSINFLEFDASPSTSLQLLMMLPSKDSSTENPEDPTRPKAGTTCAPPPFSRDVICKHFTSLLPHQSSPPPSKLVKKHATIEIPERSLLGRRHWQRNILLLTHTLYLHFLVPASSNQNGILNTELTNPDLSLTYSSSNPAVASNGSSAVKLPLPILPPPSLSIYLPHSNLYLHADPSTLGRTMPRSQPKLKLMMPGGYVVTPPDHPDLTSNAPPPTSIESEEHNRSDSDRVSVIPFSYDLSGQFSLELAQKKRGGGVLGGFSSIFTSSVVNKVVFKFLGAFETRVWVELLAGLIKDGHVEHTATPVCKKADAVRGGVSSRSHMVAAAGLEEAVSPPRNDIDDGMPCSATPVSTSTHSGIRQAVGDVEEEFIEEKEEDRFKIIMPVVESKEENANEEKEEQGENVNGSDDDFESSSPNFVRAVPCEEDKFVDEKKPDAVDKAVPKEIDSTLERVENDEVGIEVTTTNHSSPGSICKGKEDLQDIKVETFQTKQETPAEECPDAIRRAAHSQSSLPDTEPAVISSSSSQLHADAMHLASPDTNIHLTSLRTKESRCSSSASTGKQDVQHVTEVMNHESGAEGGAAASGSDTVEKKKSSNSYSHGGYYQRSGDNIQHSSDFPPFMEYTP